MKQNRGSVLTINGGSSSIRFAAFAIEASLRLIFSGEVENIGAKNINLNFTKATTNKQNNYSYKKTYFGIDQQMFEMVVTAKNRGGKIILLFGVFLVMTGLGITLPVLLFYIEKLLPSGSISSNTVSLHIGLITGSFPLTQFLFSSYLGSLSDKVGRCPLILGGIAGFSISTFIFSLGGSIVLLYISRLGAGVFTAGFVTASGAYIADITSKEKRGKNMALLSSVAGLGAVAGPLLEIF